MHKISTGKLSLLFFSGKGGYLVFPPLSEYNPDTKFGKSFSSIGSIAVDI